jgi:hypothetical protein
LLSYRGTRSRAELIAWLGERLQVEQPVTLIGFDFAFGFPAGAMRTVFDAGDWRELAERMRGLLDAHGQAVSVAMALNKKPAFRGHGPFRMGRDRTNFRFYVENGVPYYRVVETYVPQAISQWYLGAGTTVGYSTITGIAALGDLLDQRDRGKCNFRVVPFEDIEPNVHVLTEVYPAIWPMPTEPPANKHETDALKTVTGLAGIQCEQLGVPCFVEAHSPNALQRVRTEEGWMAGVF